MKIKSVLNQNLFIDYDILYDTGDNIFRSMARADEMLQELSGLMGRAEALVFRVPEKVRYASLQNSCTKVKGEIRGIDLSAYGLKASRSLYAFADQSQSVDREVAENLLDKRERTRFLRQEVDGLTQIAAFRNHHYRSNTLLKGVMGKSGNSIEDPWNPIKPLSEMRKIYERETFDVTSRPFSLTYQSAIMAGIPLDANGVPIINNAEDAKNYLTLMNFALNGNSNEPIEIRKPGRVYTYYLCENTFEEAVDIQLELQMASNNQKSRDEIYREEKKNEIKNYMMPYNNLQEGWMYQFVDLSQTGNLTVEEANGFLKGTNVLEGKGEVFVNASNLYTVNPAYLICHSLHETGNGTSNLATGNNDKGFYNMFGYGAVDGEAETAGSEWAEKKGCDNVDAAILEGAKEISASYINRSDGKYEPQSTLYEMRWAPLKTGEHQYATDIGWARNQIRKEVYDAAYDGEEINYRMPIYPVIEEEK